MGLRLCRTPLCGTAKLLRQNQNANAIRWGTLYNFRFDSTAAPAASTANIGFFKTGSPVSCSDSGSFHVRRDADANSDGNTYSNSNGNRNTDRHTETNPVTTSHSFPKASSNSAAASLVSFSIAASGKLC